MDSFLRLIEALHRRAVRFVVIGVAGANYYAGGGATLFTTRDRDLFLPADPANELAAWLACRDCGLELWAGDEPLGEPLDLWLAEQVVQRQALVQALDRRGLEVDLTLVMGDFEFSQVWNERRAFPVHGVDVPVARLSQIVQSKATAGMEKDRLFLATHREALARLIRENEP